MYEDIYVMSFDNVVEKTYLNKVWKITLRHDNAFYAFKLSKVYSTKYAARCCKEVKPILWSDEEKELMWRNREDQRS